jgi:hypothetical protein
MNDEINPEPDCSTCAKAKLSAWFMEERKAKNPEHVITCDPMQLETRVWWHQLFAKITIASFLALALTLLVVIYQENYIAEFISIVTVKKIGVFAIATLAISVLVCSILMTTPEHVAMTLAWMKHFKHLEKTRAYLFLFQQMKVPKSDRPPGFCKDTQQNFEKRLHDELADLAYKSSKGKPGSAGPCQRSSLNFKHVRDAAEAFGFTARPTSTP